MGIKVFWLEPTELERVWLRRYRSNSVYTPEGERIERPGCPLPQGYHDNSVLIVDAQPHTGHGIASPEQLEHMGVYDAPSNDDPRWPLHCECGYEFGDDDERQVFRGRLYSGALDGKLYTLSDAPIGAMWDASWHRSDGHGEPWTGPDGISLVVKTPGGHWTVDSEASNCTRTQWGPKEIDGVTHEKVWLGRTHYCWIRHGDPRTGNVHVDKNGDTCAAGAGSILSGNYHGFLHNGELVQC